MPTTDDYDKAQEQYNIQKEKDFTASLISTVFIVTLTIGIILGFVLYMATP